MAAKQAVEMSFAYTNCMRKRRYRDRGVGLVDQPAGLGDGFDVSLFEATFVRPATSAGSKPS